MMALVWLADLSISLGFGTSLPHDTPPPPVVAVLAVTAAPEVPAAPATPAPPPPPVTVAPARAAQPPPPPAPAPPPPPPFDHLIGPGVNVLVVPEVPYDCRGFGAPSPPDRAVIDPCAQPTTGVPLIIGHNSPAVLWGADSWTVGTVVTWQGHTYRITTTRVVDHWITYYPMPTSPAVRLQVRTCTADGNHEYVFDLVAA